MTFRPQLRPGQGFKPFTVYEREGTKTATGRPYTGNLVKKGSFYGIISQASPKEQEQWKQLGTPITHTIVQRGTRNRAKGNDVLELSPPTGCCNGEIQLRRFLVKGDPQNPGELGHFLIYGVEERKDLQ
jgi:hypothetical protein